MTAEQFTTYFDSLSAKQKAALGTMATGVAGMRYVAAAVDIGALAETVAEFLGAALLL